METFDENTIIEQSNLFPKLVDDEFINSYNLFTSALAHLKALLGLDFILRDYTIGINYTILEIDLDLIKELDPAILSQPMENIENLKGWIGFKYYWEDGKLKYKTKLVKPGLGI